MDSSLDDSAFELSSEPSTSASKFEDVVDHETTIGVTGAVEDNITRKYCLGALVGFDASIEDDFLPPCQGYSREEWVDLDVIMVNRCGVPVADGVCRNSDPMDCIDANPLRR